MKTMDLQEFTFRHIGPEDYAPFDIWYKQIHSTLCVEEGEVRARVMIENACRQECEIPNHRTHFSFVVCLKREKLIGMLKYHFATPHYSDLIWIEYFAVMPLYQRRGIGQKLLSELKESASGKYCLFAGPSNHPP